MKKIYVPSLRSGKSYFCSSWFLMLFFKKLNQQVTLRGQSQSTLNNYIRCIANIALHFGKLPELISDDEINEYLCALALNPKSPSRSTFKHAVYGLRYYFRLIGHHKRAIELPSLKKTPGYPPSLTARNCASFFQRQPCLSIKLCSVLFILPGCAVRKW